MRICGYCGKEYAESESKCPVCGSTMLRHNQGTASAVNDYNRIKAEVTRERAKRSKVLGIGAVVIVLAVIIAVISIGNNSNKPNRITVDAANAETRPVAQSFDDPKQDVELPNETVQNEPAGPVTVALTDLAVTKQGEYFYVGTNDYDNIYSELYDNLDGVCKDVSGNTYDRGGVHYVAYFRLNEEGESYRSITYYLNQEYDVLTGVLYRPYVTLSCGFDWDRSGCVEIYGDGVLICSESIAQNEFDPINFSVDISGVRELRIRLRGVWKDADWDEDYYVPMVCLADMEVTKQP